MRPFWRSIGIIVIKDLQTRPQKAQQLADLLEISVNQMLLLTQAETLPYLVLMKKKDILQRIARARGPSISVHDICLHPQRNLVAILALLLRQPSANIEKTAMDYLCEVAPAFREQNDLSGLVGTEPFLIACDLLKAASDEGEPRKAQVKCQVSLSHTRL